MKKASTLFVAMMLSAGMAFAQSNDASITQEGDDHSATIEQIGLDNAAYVDQTDGGSNGDATAEVSQQGDNNSVNLRQRAFYGFPDQSDATITQIGNNNRVQGTSASSAFYQNQPGGILDVYMNGDNNKLYSLRTEAQKNGNEFLLDITGSDNNVGMKQEFSTADVDISGDQNDVTLSQLSHGANWDQSLYSSATVSLTGDENDVSVDQNGVAHDASVSVGPYASNMNIVSIDQIGDANDASFSVQMGDANDVDIAQDGSANYSEYSVKYGSSNMITADISGVGNRTRLGIDAGWGSMSSGNILSVTKTGDNNYLSGSIEGSSNTVTVLQDGTGNRIGTSWYTNDGINISGSSNMVDISQMSDNNSASVSVTGSNNSATIHQN